MAYRRRTKTRRPIRRRRKTVRKRRNVRATRVLTCKTGFPRRMFVATNYVLTGSSTIATGNLVIPVQSSAFQIMTAISNSQAQYFDQYKAIYNRFRIHGMKVSVTTSEIDSSTNRGVLFGMYFTNTSTVPGTAEGAMTQPGAQYKLITTDNASKWLTGYRKCYNVLGVSKVMYNTDLAYQALVTTNPSSMMYCNIWYFNQGVTTLTVQYIIRVKLYCEYFEPALVVNA